MSRHQFTPPPAAQAKKVWTRGRQAGYGNKPRDLDVYTDRTLQLVYQRGYARGRQEALQARFGDAVRRRLTVQTYLAGTRRPLRLDVWSRGRMSTASRST